MPQKSLPIYQIKDFNAAPQQEQYFYSSTLSRHLQKHLFIQKPHKHDFYILVFITQGSGTHTIDFKEYPVTANMVFFMTPGQVHSWQLTPDTEGHILFFTPEFYLLGFPLQKLHRYPFYTSALRLPYLSLTATEMAPLLQSINLLQTEYKSQELMRDDMLREYLDVLLIQLTRKYTNHYPATQTAATILPQLQTLEALIDAHYKEHQPTTFYADKLHLTPKQLNDNCKRAFGKTPTELIQDRTILEAKRLLVHSSLTIAQVAAELGYFDNAYFFRFFKKHTGNTPEQFRKAHL